MLLLLCLLVLPLSCRKPQEVTYDGKPLRAWIAMLESPDPVARLAAARAVREIGPAARQAIPALIRTVRETRNRDRRLLLACNGAMLAMGKEIVPSMIALLGDDEWEMRRGGAWALGRLGPDARDAVPALTRALQDPHAAVRTQAAESLKKVLGEPPALGRARTGGKGEMGGE